MVRYISIIFIMLSFKCVHSQELNPKPEIVIVSEIDYSFNLHINDMIVSAVSDTLVHIKDIDKTVCKIMIEILDEPKSIIQKMIILSREKIAYYALRMEDDIYKLIFIGEKNKKFL